MEKDWSKEELLVAWQDVIHENDDEFFFRLITLSEAIGLVNMTYRLVAQGIVSWQELEEETEIERQDAVFLIRRALCGLDVSIGRANYVVVSVDQHDEMQNECLQATIKKAERIASLLRTCLCFRDTEIIVMPVEAYFEKINFSEAAFLDEKEMAKQLL